MRTTCIPLAARAAALATAAALLTPALALAGQLVVRPLQLSPLSNRQASWQDDVSVGGFGPAEAVFTTPLRLPAGTRIRGLRYQHASLGGSGTSVVIVRVRPGAAVPTQGIIGGSSSATTPALLEFTTVTGAFAPGAQRRIQAGWRYAILVTALSGLDRVGRIRVLY